MSKGLDMETALKRLKDKRDVRIIEKGKGGKLTIQVLWNFDKNGNDNRDKYHDLGNGSWGAIDYLTKHAVFKFEFVYKF